MTSGRRLSCSSVCKLLRATGTQCHRRLPVVSSEEMSRHLSCGIILFFNLKTENLKDSKDSTYYLASKESSAFWIKEMCEIHCSSKPLGWMKNEFVKEQMGIFKAPEEEKDLFLKFFTDLH